MDWEDKVKMIQLGNNKDDSFETKKQFENYVLEQIDSFDNQAWEMFCNLVQIIPSEMKNDIEFWTNVYQKIKNVDCNDGFGLRTGMRIALIQTICEDEFNLN